MPGASCSTGSTTRLWATCTAGRCSATPYAARGSPIAYSSARAHHVKGSWLVDLDASGVAAAEFVEAPVRDAWPRSRAPSTTCSPRPCRGRVRGSRPRLTTEPADRRHGPLRARFPHVVALRRPRSRAAHHKGAPTTSPSTSSATCVVARRPRPSPCCSGPWSAAPTTATWRHDEVARLSATAFGHAETVSFDFDEKLSAGGLFLLTGDTGAGRGRRPRRGLLRAVRRGPRRQAHRRHLHSDHADPQAEPRVTLEVRTSGRAPSVPAVPLVGAAQEAR